MSTAKIKPDEYYDQKNLDEQRKLYQEMCKGGLYDLQLKNFLWNMVIIQATHPPGILGFKEIFKRVPAVVVGAGPSLDKNGYLLNKYKDNFIIVSCDAALPILVNKYDVYPHFVVMVDPTPKQKHNFKDIDTTKFYTIVPPVVDPSIFRSVDPKHLAVFNIKDTKNTLFEQIPYHIGRKGALPAAILTTGDCYCFAAAMGCNPIMFVGMDLSWPSTDKVYADGIVDWKVNYQKGAKFKAHCMLFPDINGKLVLTHQTLLMFWAWLRENSKFCAHTLINCSEAGILHFKGMKVIPFQKSIDKYANKKLVGVDEKIERAYNYEYADGLVEELLLPPFKKEYLGLRHRLVGSPKK